DDSDDDVAVAADLRDVVHRADPQLPHALADLLRVDVEDGGDVDPVLGEDGRARNRASQAAGTDERDVVLALRAQDLPDLLEQRVRAVADPALAEAAEGGEIA